MGKSNDDIFELMAANKKRRDTITALLSNIEALPHLCFAKKRLRDGDYWTMEGKRTTGTIQIMDLPEDLGLKESAITTLKAEFTRLQKEFNSYTINK